MAKQKNIFLPRTRLNPKTDQDIIDWLSSLDEYGKKGQAIKEALRRGFSNAQTQPQPQTQSQSQTFSDKKELLGDFRLIVEASLESHLSGLQVTVNTKEKETFDSETEEMLDNFASLMI